MPRIIEEKDLKKPLLVSDEGLKEVGLVKRAEDILNDEDIEFRTFLDVQPNPSIENVEDGYSRFEEYDCDSVICLGGGSPIDAAKSIAILAANDGDIIDYEGVHAVENSPVPIIAAPTTAGTGSEVTPVSVITDEENNFKFTIYSHKIIPEVSLLDPDLITSLPADIAASTGMDALTHAVEAYLSKVTNPFADALAEKAMELIGKNVRKFVADRKDNEAASSMLLGSMFAGLAFSWGRLGNVHAMAEPLGVYFDIPHGTANAVLLPVVLDYNALADKGKYRRIYNYISRKEAEGFSPGLLAEKVYELNEKLGNPGSLSELDVDPDCIPEMAEDAMKSGNVKINPRQTDFDDICRLYQKAL
ncbi:alcohol dehydrogenase [Halarsenatibacter silvermanii]|uniref:Alcohol dehydrogenase n=1 Tax=Halarsenatibacter silvermanii TaxID=321763 RepID=A0A1G9N219_9FIRM|nr:alcohol dehydrogenase [Halarsenatibacter silvermanii]